VIIIIASFHQKENDSIDLKENENENE